MTERQRCGWAVNHPLEMTYHDREWGVPRSDENRLFEALSLEGAQAGLSWLTVLKKRENYRRAFQDFHWNEVAKMTGSDIDDLMADPGLIRHRGKLESVVANARAIARLHERGGSLARLVWSLADGTPVQNDFAGLDEVPTRTARSEQLSKQLKRAGFRFVGPTTCYAFMQAVGVVNDHTTDCFRHQPVRAMAESFEPPAAR